MSDVHRGRWTLLAWLAIGCFSNDREPVQAGPPTSQARQECVGVGTIGTVLDDPTTTALWVEVADSLVAWSPSVRSYESAREQFMAARELSEERWRLVSPAAFRRAYISGTSNMIQRLALTDLLGWELRNGWADPIEFYGSAMYQEPEDLRHLIVNAASFVPQRPVRLRMLSALACMEMVILEPLFGGDPVAAAEDVALSTAILVKSITELHALGPDGRQRLDEIVARLPEGSGLLSFVRRVRAAAERHAAAMRTSE